MKANLVFMTNPFASQRKLLEEVYDLLTEFTQRKVGTVENIEGDVTTKNSNLVEMNFIIADDEVSDSVMAAIETMKNTKLPSGKLISDNI